MNKSTQDGELKKNSQKRLGFSQIRLLPKDCYLPSFFQQASLTHSEKGCSFLSASIFSTKSFSNRIFFLVDVVRLSVLGELILFSSCIVVRTHTIFNLLVRTNIQQDDDLA
ncbi:hypothetical protein [Aliiglaciecola lipolytica]|uniref:hypothetical protein n=1 Tax=Aliiglaciecola lipolytica TaxID=477689 RepID=UPI00129C239B|nr:hypothetical protein [Aliiglaciecola lipolytica]